MIRPMISRWGLPFIAVHALATPAHAQAAGPLRPAPLDAARFAAPAAMRRADASVVLAGSAELSRPNLARTIPLSALLGAGGMIVGYGAGLVVFDCQDEAPGCAHAPDDFEYTLAYAGAALGAATGAHIGGKTRDSKGSFWATVGGAAVGALPILLAPKDDDQTGAYVGTAVGATAGAVLVDYLVRRPR
jgi:hypothetical protein